MSSNARQLAANLPREGGFGLRNFIVNGEMQVAQRGVSVSFGAGYTLDRWRIVGGSSPARVATQESNTSYSTLPHEKFLKCTNPQGQDMWTTQRIENARQFSGKTLTISYWVWSTTGSYSATSGSWGKFQAVNGGTAYNVSGWGGASVSVTTTPQYVTHTINFADISSYAHTEGDFFEWNVYHNTTNDICITGVQLEVGDTATPFEHRSYGDELARCQRYYYRSDGIYRDAGVTTSGYMTTEWALPVQMRAVGTAQVFGYPSGTSGRVSYFTGTWNDTASFSFPHIGPNYFSIQYNNVTASQMGLSFTIDAEL